MEAAIRTAYEIITGREVPFEHLDIKVCRGMEGIKEAGVPLTNVKKEFAHFEGVTLQVAIAHSLANARTLCDRIRELKKAKQPIP